MQPNSISLYLKCPNFEKRRHRRLIQQHDARLFPNFSCTIFKSHPNKSSNAPPPFVFCPVLCIGAVVELAAGAPQIPAAAFCFCISANFGPPLLGVDVFLMPAPALVDDHKEAKASPPDEDGLAAGLEKLLVGAIEGLLPGADGGCEGGVGAWTEVK